jgi:histidinol-phosphate/aromatic aminotransferase/cobyric acid decarboxylase-like protein
MQPHGGDIYSALGMPRAYSDFSTTVCGHLPGLAARVQAVLPRLKAYPQPYAAGLAMQLAQLHGLPGDCLLATHGSSEALRLAFEALPGPVALEWPCFPELPRLSGRLKHATCQVAGAKGQPPSLAQLKQAVPCKGSLWLANPSSPWGRLLPKTGLLSLAKKCAQKGSVLVLDESLKAQVLGPYDSLLGLAHKTPGLLVLGSVTKALGLPGLRLGWVAGQPSLIQALRARMDPWNVDGLAQALGVHLARQAQDRTRVQQQALGRAKADLLACLKPLIKLGLKPQLSCTGYFLVQLPPKISSQNAADQLKAQGILVRACDSFGPWASHTLRLNPQTPKANRGLALALGRILSTPSCDSCG